jgi:crotonobetainyl-CoA:carnitine CoA-transferase CaiB-like acyl-CoA transferase
MSRPLSKCSLSGSFENMTPAFMPVLSSLLYQADTLGIALTADNRPGRGEGLAFRFEAPRLSPIDCEIQGWANGLAEGASEHTLQAASGLMSVHGRASGKAQGLGLDYVSTLAASLALQGTFAAALGQLRGGSFSRARVSLASAAMLGVGQYLAGATVPDGAEQLLPGCSARDERPPFVSADGVVFELETLDAEPWRRFWSALGIQGELAGKGWNAFLMRYAKALAPVPALLMQTLAGQPYARIAELCEQTGVSICPLRSLAARRGDAELPRQLEQGPWSFALESIGLQAAPRPVYGDLPLHGLRVIESCRRIQGPLAGHLLSLLGAEVVRLELPGGDPLRGMPPLVDGCSVRFDALNRYKQVREVNIKSAQGRAEIHELVRHADVFLHNWAPGKAAELALDHADLARINPALVYAYAGGWGDDRCQQGVPGTDFMVQAHSGVARQIGEASGSAGGSLFTVLDVLGGVVAAQGITAALLNRSLQGQAGRVDSSLLGAATLLCAAELQALPGAAPRASALKAVYPTASGLLAIDCHDQTQLEYLSRALDCQLAAEPEKRDRQLRRVFGQREAQEWQEILKGFGVPASVVVEDLSAVLEDRRIQPCLSVNAYALVNAPWSFI